MNSPLEKRLGIRKSQDQLGDRWNPEDVSKPVETQKQHDGDDVEVEQQSQTHD
jgi:hypothetical protein